MRGPRSPLGFLGKCRSKKRRWKSGSAVVASHSTSGAWNPHTWVRDPAHFEGLFRREEKTPAPTCSEPPANLVCRPLRIYAEMVEGGRPWSP